MKLALLVIVLILALPNIALAEKTITITLTDEEYAAMTVLTSTPEQWVKNAATAKANKMIDRLCEKYSDKKISRMTKTEKNDLIKTIDLDKERNERRGINQ